MGSVVLTWLQALCIPISTTMICTQCTTWLVDQTWYIKDGLLADNSLCSNIWCTPSIPLGGETVLLSWNIILMMTITISVKEKVLMAISLDYQDIQESHLKDLSTLQEQDSVFMSKGQIQIVNMISSPSHLESVINFILSIIASMSMNKKKKNTISNMLLLWS